MADGGLGIVALGILLFSCTLLSALCSCFDGMRWNGATVWQGFCDSELTTMQLLYVTLIDAFTSVSRITLTHALSIKSTHNHMINQLLTREEQERPAVPRLRVAFLSPAISFSALGVIDELL